MLGAALLGGPVSTTHVISSAIMGVGAAERLSKVHWSVAMDMLWAWVLTIPLTGLAGGLVYPGFRAAGW
ncbi:MAG: inorganic phosphate transporter [Chloroflexi bacterium]|nr:inorganic phosphate transporter [Chloroflexota bacterium]